MNKFLALSTLDVVFIMLITGSTVAQWLSAGLETEGAVGSSLTGVTALWSLSKTHLS